MPELVLLSLQRDSLTELRKRAAHGDAHAQREIGALWADYASVDLECFLCAAIVEKPVATLMLPELKDASKQLAAPLCAACRTLPEMVKLHRALKLLKKMWTKRGGPQMHFVRSSARR
jgi:hypothetical protein